MIDIEVIKNEIVEAIKPLDPDEIVLFGSHAYGKPTEESDIDLLIVKNIPKERVRHIRLQARKQLRSIIAKYHVGIDIVVDSKERIFRRIDEVKDQYYKEIIEQGKRLYAK